MNTYKEITQARKLLNVPERATMKEIRTKYKKLLAQWHPDRCEGNEEECNEMTIKLIAAYKTLLNYCNNYKYSFTKEEIKNHLSGEEWWFERFGDDPLWSRNGKRR